MRTLALLVALAFAPRQAPNPVQWRLAVATVRGARRMVVLTARIAPGWRLYSLTQPAGGPIATSIAVVGDESTTAAGRIERPAPDTVPDAVFGTLSEVYRDSVAFRVPVFASRAARVSLAVTYQVCSSRVCLVPRTDTLSAAVPSGR